MDLAFWGRVSTEDNQDPESSRGWQITRAKTLIKPHGGRIVAEFFDIDKSRSIPPQRRPQSSALLAALADPHRGFSAVVVGEPQRAFYGNQFGNTFPIFAHYGVPLWVPEVGGPIDPGNEAHDLIMSVFGGVSKGERNRIKIRVRTAHGRPGPARRPIPRRPSALRIPAHRRRPAPQPGQSRRRETAARARHR
jgi:DNA invertase Pin-like site-specific DNA recombinase